MQSCATVAAQAWWPGNKPLILRQKSIALGIAALPDHSNIHLCYCVLFVSFGHSRSSTEIIHHSWMHIQLAPAKSLIQMLSAKSLIQMLCGELWEPLHCCTCICTCHTVSRCTALPSYPQSAEGCCGVCRSFMISQVEGVFANFRQYFQLSFAEEFPDVAAAELPWKLGAHSSPLHAPLPLWHCTHHTWKYAVLYALLNIH